jgi:hypothetical protein
LSTGHDGWLFHDDLAPINDAFHVRDFVSRAARHSLQYLGDAQPHLMFDTRAPLGWVGGDVIEREQYFDFLCLRPFRQTLLCGSEAKLERPAGPERMDRFLFSSPARQSKGHIEGLHSVRLDQPPEVVLRVASAMGAVYPRPVAFDRLLESTGDREALRAILFSFIASGFALLHTYYPGVSESAGARPKANRLARWEGAHTGVLSYANHTANSADGLVRALIELLDGTRDSDGLACALAKVEGAPPLDEIREQLPHVLTHMLHAGLLEEP